jgi:hypothetical protein
MDTSTFTRLAGQATFHDAGHGYDVFDLGEQAVEAILAGRRY